MDGLFTILSHQREEIDLNSAVPDPPDDQAMSEAFLRLFTREQFRIAGFVRSLVMNQVDAGDVLQETSLALWRSFHQYESDRDFFSWSLGVARHQVLKHFRAKRRDRLTFSESLLSDLADETADMLSDDQPRYQALRECVSQLTARQRVLIREFYTDGVAANEIAKRWNRNVQAVYNSLRDVRRQLQDCINRRLNEFEATKRLCVSQFARTRRVQPAVRNAIAVTAVAACLLWAVVWFSTPNGKVLLASEPAYDLRPIPIRTVGYVAADRDRRLVFPVLAGSNASPASPTEMATADGTTVDVVPGSLYGFSTETIGLLFRGEVLVSSLDSKCEYAVEMENVRVVARRARFRIHRGDDGSAVVEALKGQVEIQARGRVPRLYWSFDDVEGGAGLPLELGSQASRATGLLGSGALRFVDQRGTCANVVGGTGEKVGSGSFSMSGGMTIEAIISSTWDGAEENQDVIFRKEDGPNRILLSFQNNVNDFAIPKVPRGPVLSFGISLRELGYSELDMPLDGKNGRPTVAQIADGMPHTVATTYDCFSGIKAIAIDGQIRFSHRFPIGHCIQSGGPKPAMIGGWRKRETFGGVIDELAIYDYPLSREEMIGHHELANQGTRWLPSQFVEQPNWMTTQTVAQGQRCELSPSNIEQESVNQ